MGASLSPHLLCTAVAVSKSAKRVPPRATAERVLADETVKYRLCSS